MAKGAVVSVDVSDRSGEGGRRGWVVGLVGGVGVAALVGFAAFGPWFGGASPDVSPSASPTDPSASPALVAILPDVQPAADVPWDDVGPGWFLIAFDPEPSPTVDGDESWDLAAGDVWLLSTDGQVFEGPPAPAGTGWISYWSGTEIWYAILAPALEQNCGEQICGETVARDSLTGEEWVPWSSRVVPGRVFPTATGTYLVLGGCCLGWDAQIRDATGNVVDFASGSAEWGSPSLSPDGTRLIAAQISPAYVDGVAVEGTDGIEMWSLDGTRHHFPTSQMFGGVTGWLDNSTVLLATWTSENAEGPPVYTAFDTIGGGLAPWTPPRSGRDWYWPQAPGVIASASDDGTANVGLTRIDGSYEIVLDCLGLECQALVSGDQLLWAESLGYKGPAGRYWEERDVRQRLTLVDLTTGAQTVIVDVSGSAGRILDVAPHAATYG